jgi:hypothetical protein
MFRLRQSFRCRAVVLMQNFAEGARRIEMMKNWSKILNLSTHTTTLVFGNLRFILFIGGLTLVYITNALYAEKKIHTIQRMEKDIKELKWEYMAIKRDVLYRSMQSQMDGNVESLGLNLSQGGPKVIEVKR